MESVDHPSAFGQHINAEITSQILDANSLLDDIVTLTPQKITTVDGNSDKLIMDKLKDIWENIPEEMSLREVKLRHKKDESPLKTVLLQEISRYNELLSYLKKSIEILEKGI